MKIVVCVKQVAALDEEFELREDGLGVDPDSLERDLNEWDSFSLEAALQLREQTGGDGDEVVAVTVGDEEADEALLGCLARGADRAVRVWDEDVLTRGDVLVNGPCARRRRGARAAGPRPVRSPVLRRGQRRDRNRAGGAARTGTGRGGQAARVRCRGGRADRRPRARGRAGGAPANQRCRRCSRSRPGSTSRATRRCGRSSRRARSHWRRSSPATSASIRTSLRRSPARGWRRWHHRSAGRVRRCSTARRPSSRIGSWSW